MNTKRGFTLVELLVVIAILGILAAIVVPNVASYIGRAKFTQAQVQIANIETALVKMQTDAGVSNFRHLFSAQTRNDLRWMDAAIAANYAYMADVVNYVYTPIFYELLKDGRDAQVPLDPDVRPKLGSFYLELDKDAWGKSLYRFYAGPWPKALPNNQEAAPVLLRTWRIDLDVPGNRPGPRFSDWQQFGFPANEHLPIYIWSQGANLLDDQLYAYAQGTQLYMPPEEMDDVNNWDKNATWMQFAP